MENAELRAERDFLAGLRTAVKQGTETGSAGELGLARLRRSVRAERRRLSRRPARSRPAQGRAARVTACVDALFREVVCERGPRCGFEQGGGDTTQREFDQATRPAEMTRQREHGGVQAGERIRNRIAAEDREYLKCCACCWWCRTRRHRAEGPR